MEGNMTSDIMNSATDEEFIEKLNKSNLKNKTLNDYEKDFVNKIILFQRESLSLLSYASSMPYLNTSLNLLVKQNEKNFLNNPFSHLIMVAEDAIFKIFIVTFANLFNLRSVKKDTFSIYSIFKSIGDYDNGVIVITTLMPNLIKNNHKTREAVKKVFDFLGDKDNKKVINAFDDIRDHDVAHATVKEKDYKTILTNLNLFIDFLNETLNSLYQILNFKNSILFKEAYEKYVDKWAFFLNNVTYNSKFLTSDALTKKILDAFVEGKKNKIDNRTR